jgi:hypothetical protein
MYKLTIKIKNEELTFTTSTYSISENRIIFRDKFGNKKNFSALPETLIGIEESDFK